MAGEKQGFCIFMDNGKYAMAPNTGEHTNVIVFAETTDKVESLLSALVTNKILDELGKVSNFPIVSATVVQTLSGTSMSEIRGTVAYLRGDNNEFH